MTRLMDYISGELKIQELQIYKYFISLFKIQRIHNEDVSHKIVLFKKLMLMCNRNVFIDSVVLMGIPAHLNESLVSAHQ